MAIKKMYISGTLDLSVPVQAPITAYTQHKDAQLVDYKKDVRLYERQLTIRCNVVDDYAIIYYDDYNFLSGIGISDEAIVKIVCACRKRVEGCFENMNGNKGGDYLRIMNLGDNLVHLEVGASCVKVIDNVVPIELLTQLLVREVLEHGSLEGIVDSFINLSPSYKEYLKIKVGRRVKMRYRKEVQDDGRAD